jgi:hypothetical protein
MRLGQDNVEWRALLKVALTYCAESTIRNLWTYYNRSSVFWYTMPCTAFEVKRRFGGTSPRLIRLPCRPKRNVGWLSAVCRRNIPEERTLHDHRCVKLKYCVLQQNSNFCFLLFALQLRFCIKVIFSDDVGGTFQYCVSQCKLKFLVTIKKDKLYNFCFWISLPSYSVILFFFWIIIYYSSFEGTANDLRTNTAY